MQMLDLATREEWEALEKEIHDSTGLSAAAYGADGFRITGYENWANSLCPAIKDDPKALQQICSLANQFFLTTMRETGEPLVDQCDAGFLKVAVPVLDKGEMIGFVGGCGHMPKDGELETYLVHMAAGMDEDEAAAKAADARIFTEEEAARLVAMLQERVAALQAR